MIPQTEPNTERGGQLSRVGLRQMANLLLRLGSDGTGQMGVIASRNVIFPLQGFHIGNMIASALAGWHHVMNLPSKFGIPIPVFGTTHRRAASVLSIRGRIAARDGASFVPDSLNSVIVKRHIVFPFKILVLQTWRFCARHSEDLSMRGFLQLVSGLLLRYSHRLIPPATPQ